MLSITALTSILLFNWYITYFMTIDFFLGFNFLILTLNDAFVMHHCIDDAFLIYSSMSNNGNITLNILLTNLFPLLFRIS